MMRREHARMAGRHRLNGTPWRAWARVLLIVILVPVAVAILMAAWAWRTGRRAAGRAARWGWRWAAWYWRILELRGRLRVASVLSVLAAMVAGDFGIIPGGDIGALMAGVAGACFFGLWLIVHKAAGTRRWRQLRGGPVIDNEVAQLTDALLAGLARIDNVEAKVADLLALLVRETDGVLPTWPDHQATDVLPRLSVVPDRRDAGEAV